jgi:hypothetical protein
MTETMRWYNPTRRVEEEVPAPMSEAQAIEMLSGHLDSDRFIEVYRQMRSRHPDLVQALILRERRSTWSTGEHSRLGRAVCAGCRCVK